MKPVVFVPEPIDESGLELLRAECVCVTPWEDDPGTVNIHDDGYRVPLYEAEAVIVRLFEISQADIARTKRLRVIGKHGVGVDNIDCEAAAAAGIPVVYTPTANANAVAEHALALMLALSRQIGPASEALKEGRFSERGRYQGIELAGKTLGVMGLGRVGSKVAQMAALGLEMSVLAHDPFVSKDSYDGPATLEDSLETFMRKVDFLSLHMSLTPDTKHIINDQTLGWVKPNCRIINTSRGAVIDEDALARALSEGRLAGAALDVFTEEPLPPDHPLVHAPHTLLTPHISSSTQESLARMSTQAAQGVLDVLWGRTPQYLVNVNPETLT
jgi:D-3-phosphoglycerate dehydrogenase